MNNPTAPLGNPTAPPVQTSASPAQTFNQQHPPSGPLGPPGYEAQQPLSTAGGLSDPYLEGNGNAVQISSDPPPGIDSFEAPPGYDSQTVLSPGAPLPPPSDEPLDDPSDEANRPEETFTGIGITDEQQVRDAICAFADKKCCYGTGAAERMTLEKMEPSGGLHYQLESFTETRTTSWQHLPYEGGLVDGPECGQAPAAWDILCQPDALFQSHTKKGEVPHTSNVKVCHTCSGSGRVRCSSCSGSGRVRCFSCGGSGRRTVHRNGRSESERCFSCGGSGRRSCSSCCGSGRVTCSSCRGHGKLRWFIELTVDFTNNVEDFIHETTDLPDELIRDVSGKVVFEQTLPHVWPISQYHVDEINVNSIRIVERHKTAWPDSKMLQQRQVLRSVPVTEVHYKFKDKDGRFWVYGNEQEVHCPDYPQSCCWGCTII